MKSRPLNLLDSLEQEQNQWDQVANWALTIGRWIVILTEIVVIGALIFRFNIDKQLSNLRRTVEQNRQLLENSLQRSEQRFHHTQLRLNLLAQDIQQQHDYADLLLTVAKSIPDQGIALNKITPTPSTSRQATKQPTSPSLRLTGVADKEEYVSGFVHQLRLSGKFTRVTVKNLLVDEQNPERVNFELVSQVDLSQI